MQGSGSQESHPNRQGVAGDDRGEAQRRGGASHPAHARGEDSSSSSYQDQQDLILERALETSRGIATGTATASRSHNQQQAQAGSELFWALSVMGSVGSPRMSSNQVQGLGGGLQDQRAGVLPGQGDTIGVSDRLRMMQQVVGMTPNLNARLPRPSSTGMDATVLRAYPPHGIAPAIGAPGLGGRTSSSELRELLWAQMQSEQRQGQGPRRSSEDAMQMQMQDAISSSLLRERMLQQQLEPQTSLYNRAIGTGGSISEAARRAGLLGRFGGGDPVLGFNNPNPTHHPPFDTSPLPSASGLEQQLYLERLEKLRCLKLLQAQQERAYQDSQRLFPSASGAGVQGLVDQGQPTTSSAAGTAADGLGFSLRALTAAAASTASATQGQIDEEDDDRATPPEERKRPASVSGITPSVVATAASASQRSAAAAPVMAEQDQETKKKRPLSEKEAALKEKQIKRLKAQALQSAAQAFAARAREGAGDDTVNAGDSGSDSANQQAQPSGYSEWAATHFGERSAALVANNPRLAAAMAARQQQQGLQQQQQSQGVFSSISEPRFQQLFLARRLDLEQQILLNRQQQQQLSRGQQGLPPSVAQLGSSWDPNSLALGGSQHQQQQSLQPSSSDLAALMASMGGGMNRSIPFSLDANNMGAQRVQAPHSGLLAMGNLQLHLQDASAAALRAPSPDFNFRPRTGSVKPPPQEASQPAAGVAAMPSSVASSLSLPSPGPIRLEKPKRPLSAYNLFFRDERARMLEELERNPPPSPPSSSSAEAEEGGPAASPKKKKRKRRKKPKIAFAALAKTIGPKWKTISPKLLEKYKAMAVQEKERYTLECAQYKVHQSRQEHKKAAVKSAAAEAKRKKEDVAGASDGDEEDDDDVKPTSV